MNENNPDSFPSNWEKEKLDSIRSQLENSTALQEAMDNLLKHIAIHGIELKASEVGNEMISLMISEAQKGVDIHKRFPTFFEELLKNAELRSVFLDALNISEESGDDLLLDVSDADLMFIKHNDVQPVIKIKSRGKWQVHWQRTVAQLQSVFSPPSLAFRSDLSLFEDPWFTLLRDELEIEESTLAIVLEGTLSKESDDSLEVILKVALTNLTTREDRKQEIRALLQWGDYSEETWISEQGRGTFPPVPLGSILDVNKQEVVTGLHLNLDTGLI